MASACMVVRHIVAMPSSAYAAARTGSLIFATTFAMPSFSRGQLGGHDVPVVALGERQEDVGIGGPGSTERVLVGPVATDGAAPELGRKAVEGARRKVDHDHVVAVGVVGLGQDGTHAARPDNHDLHVASSAIGSRTTQTAHGAFFRT